jgi:hypothetical protein
LTEDLLDSSLVYLDLFLLFLFGGLFLGLFLFGFLFRLLFSGRLFFLFLLLILVLLLLFLYKRKNTFRLILI